ncbi:MAG: hypothetical protein JSV08_06725 [Acidobacteriota bacterium]|nr:MAG: hypothetical protein JSV08_06725 [Acidobacteriota bacterium]
MDSPLARLAIIVGAMVLLVGGAWLYFETREPVPCPVVEEAYVVSSTMFSETASDTWKNIPYGENAVLAAVVRLRDPRTGEAFYVSPVERVTLQGERISREKMRRWPRGCGRLVFLWFTVEPQRPGRPGPDAGTEAASPYKNRLCGSWGFRPTHYADVRPRALLRQDPDRPNVGAMFYRVRAEVRNPKTHRLLQSAASPGAEYLNAGGDPSRVHRVAIGEE